MQSRHAGAGAILLVAALAGLVTSSRAARGVSIGISMLQAEADSVQIEMAWTAGFSNRPITGYGVMISGYVSTSGEGSPLWVRTDTVALGVHVDTLWVPQDTTERPAIACVRTLTSNKLSDFSCTSFTIPSQVIVTPPGLPNVKIISAIGMTFDSLQISGLAADLLRPVGSLSMIEGQIAVLGALAWKHAAAGPIAFTCVRFDAGPQGWKEMRLNEAEGVYTDPPGGLFIPDSGCGFAWRTTDPSVASVSTQDIPLGQLSMVDAAVLRAETAAPRPLPSQAL